MWNLFFLRELLLPQSAEAHVKWFSNFDFTQAPLKMAELSSGGTFWFLMCLSIISLPLIVYLDRALENSLAYIKINSFLDRYADNAQLIMRVIVGAVLLMSWQGDSVIAPEIPIFGDLWGWAQFSLVFLLLFKETTWIVGLGMLTFYGMSVYYHGIFHMLDYMIYPAVGLYFILSSSKNERIKNLDLPVLYSGLGFSLCWVAFEKLVYPYWGLSVLEKAPELSMGLNHQFFLTSTAFVEFTLGYLLIICLLHRPLAIVITLVFFTTTVFFGKTEVIGHTILHGALLVFVVKGPGQYYQAPIRFHQSPWMRSLFASINFVILFLVLGYSYEKLAGGIHLQKMASIEILDHPQFEIPSALPAPTIKIELLKDSVAGWNLHLITENFKFTPEEAGNNDLIGTGHGHIYVDGKKIGRVYGPWFHVNLEKGTHQIKVSLNTNRHKDYFANGKAIEATVEVVEDRETQAHKH